MAVNPAHIYKVGDPLPCCGCGYTVAARLDDECDCRCHETPRLWRDIARRD